MVATPQVQTLHVEAAQSHYHTNVMTYGAIFNYSMSQKGAMIVFIVS